MYRHSYILYRNYSKYPIIVSSYHRENRSGAGNRKNMSICITLDVRAKFIEFCPVRARVCVAGVQTGSDTGRPEKTYGRKIFV